MTSKLKIGKISYYRMKLILQIFSIVIVFAFLATSAETLNINSEPNIPHSAETSSGFIHFSSSSNNLVKGGSVQYTRVHSNNSLLHGNRCTGTNTSTFNHSRSGVFDSENGYIHMTNYLHNTGNLSVINSSTNKIESKYSVIFTESGLPSNATWYVNITGQASSGPINEAGTFNIYLVNGTYNYTSTTSNKQYYAYGATYGKTTVSGSSDVIQIPFYSELFKLNINETGLPYGNSWYVNLSTGMKSHQITGSIYTTDLMNGTYNFTVATSNKSLEVSSAPGTFTINGATVNVSVKFSELFTVTLTETGLPSIDYWNVNITGESSSDSGQLAAGSSYSFSLINGSYQYNIVTNDKIYHANAGSFTVNGASLTESVSFSYYTYSVTFSESGLPSGDLWYVNLSNEAVSGAISTLSYSFSLINGTYQYNIATNDKIYHANAGSFTVNGASLTESVSFALYKYSITFTETGLPSDTTWFVNITGQTSSGLLSAGSSFTVVLTNGTYYYLIGTPHKIYATNTYEFQVIGKALSEAITFSKVLYNVTFTETGLKSGTSWSVTFDGLTQNSTNSSIIFTAVNGSHTYKIGNVSGYTVSPTSGSPLINGKNVSIFIAFKSNPASVLTTEEIYVVIGTIVGVLLISFIVWKRKEKEEIIP